MFKLIRTLFRRPTVILASGSRTVNILLVKKDVITAVAGSRGQSKILKSIYLKDDGMLLVENPFTAEKQRAGTTIFDGSSMFAK